MSLEIITPLTPCAYLTHDNAPGSGIEPPPPGESVKMLFETSDAMIFEDANNMIYESQIQKMLFETGDTMNFEENKNMLFE